MRHSCHKMKSTSELPATASTVSSHKACVKFHQFLASATDEVPAEPEDLRSCMASFPILPAICIYVCCILPKRDGNLGSPSLFVDGAARSCFQVSHSVLFVSDVIYPILALLQVKFASQYLCRIDWGDDLSSANRDPYKLTNALAPPSEELSKSFVQSIG